GSAYENLLELQKAIMLPARPFVNGKVLVAHPEQQHSNPLAAALASAGLLCKYICGTPQDSEMRHLIGPEKIKRLLLWLPLRRAATHMLPRGARLEAVHRLAR